MGIAHLIGGIFLWRPVPRERGLYYAPVTIFRERIGHSEGDERAEGMMALPPPGSHVRDIIYNSGPIRERGLPRWCGPKDVLIRTTTWHLSAVRARGPRGISPGGLGRRGSHFAHMWDSQGRARRARGRGRGPFRTRRWDVGHDGDDGIERGFGSAGCVGSMRDALGSSGRVGCARLLGQRAGGRRWQDVVTRAYDTNVAEYPTPLLVSHPARCWPRAPAVVGRLWGGGTWGGRVTFAFPPPSLGA